MLESYQQEVETRRRGRRVFWFFTLLGTGFLYLFFQGYYPYISIDFNNILRPSSNGGERPQIVRAFGIINIRATPAPDRILVGNQGFSNGDKGIYDFGSYDIQVEKAGYISLSTTATLDKKNPFHIEALELLKNPQYHAFRYQVESAISLWDGKIVLKESPSLSWSTKSSTPTYHIVSEEFKELWKFKTDAKPIGNEYWSGTGNTLFILDQNDQTLRALAKTGTGGVLSCKDPKIVQKELYCEDTKTFLTGDHAGVKERLISAGEKLIRVADGIVSSTSNSSDSGSLRIAEDTLRIAGKDYILSKGGIFESSARDALAFDITPLATVGKVATFGREAFLIGYPSSGSGSVFQLIDERGNRYLGSLSDAGVRDISISVLGSGYLISTKNTLFFYQKWAHELARIVDGKILSVSQDSVLFNKNGHSYLMKFEYGDR